MRIIAFIGSPVGLDEKEIIKLAKRLKKEKVNVDVVSFGEEVKIYLMKLELYDILYYYSIFRLKILMY